MRLGFVILLTFGLIVITFGLISGVNHYFNSRDLEQVQGKVIQSDYSFEELEGGYRSHAQIRFRYVVNGIEYIGDRIDQSGKIVRRVALVRKLVNDHPIGSDVLVSYSRRAPSEGFLVGAPSTYWIPLVFGGLFTIFSFVAFCLDRSKVDVVRFMKQNTRASFVVVGPVSVCLIVIGLFLLMSEYAYYKHVTDSDAWSTADGVVVYSGSVNTRLNGKVKKKKKLSMII